MEIAVLAPVLFIMGAVVALELVRYVNALMDEEEWDAQDEAEEHERYARHLFSISTIK